MQTLISKTLTHPLTPQFASPIFLFHFPSLSWKNPNFHNYSHRKYLSTPKTLIFSSATPSDSLNYGGWDDLKLGGDSAHSGESNQLHKFLNSLGTDDKKYIFVYLLGFICALAISRVRVSSIIVFPVCFIVFAVGFSIGFVNRGKLNELSLIGNKTKPKDEGFRVSIDKMRNLVDLFNGFDIKIVNLKNDIKRGIKSNKITVGDLESYIKVIESIGLSGLNARNVVEGCIDNMLVETQEVERNSNQKSSKRKKEVDGTGFDLSQFVAGLFRENFVGLKPNKMKDLVKREATSMPVNDHNRGNILAPAVEERILSSVSNDDVGNGNVGFSRDTFNNGALIQDRAEEFIDGTRRIKAISENEKLNLTEIESGVRSVFDSKEYNFQNKKLRFMENEQISLNMGHRKSVETWAAHDGLVDLDFSVSFKHMGTEASFGQEQKFKKSNGYYKPSDMTKKSANETYRSRVREERVVTDNDPSLADKESDFSSSPSSMVTDDIVFNKFLMEANILLKQARECLRNRVDEGEAEASLCKSARLLSQAIDMKPMSLLAVGQLGNTYLLHGELKLKISRKLRALLARSDPSVDMSKVKGLDDQIARKEKVASVLVDICEECEELLVKAGRKYRLALSIDGNDMRSLYNWGLALSFRAQLIADIGPEAAFDADKVFLAAIDKFDAMMSKSNVYAPDALFRWGMALQQRSRLRTRNGKEKLKLLQQAQRLYEDALHMNSDNLQVREALSSCLSELNYRNY